MECKRKTFYQMILDDRTDSPVLNLSKVNDFRMGGFAAEFARSNSERSARENSLVSIGSHHRDNIVHQINDERRYHEEDDIVSDDDLEDDNKSSQNVHEALSDKDRANNNKGGNDDDDVDDVDEDEDEDNMSAALGPLAGFQNLIAAAAASGAAGNPAGGAGEAGSDPASAGQLSSVYGLIGNIQALLKMAVENAKKEERQLMSQKSKRHLYMISG